MPNLNRAYHHQIFKSKNELPQLRFKKRNRVLPRVRFLPRCPAARFNENHFDLLVGVGRLVVFDLELHWMKPEIIALAPGETIELIPQSIFKLISSAKFDDVEIDEGGKIRTIKPADQQLFLFHLAAQGNDKTTEFAATKRELSKATGLNERFIQRLTTALLQAGVILADKIGQKTKFRVLTTAIERKFGNE